MSERIASDESFDRAGRRLEDAFFLQQDRILIERLNAMKKMAESKESLSKVSGITNDAVLSRLVEMNVRPESLAALATIPLVEVAWADGKIEAPERKTVLEHANAQGIRPGSVEHDLLDRWLTHRPDPKLLEAWRAYVRGLCEKLDADEKALLKNELLHAAQETARSAGGFLGIGKVSADEQRMLDTLAATFSK